MKLKQRNKWIDWGVLSFVISLAGPTMLEQLMQTAVQYIDTAMVGSLGTDATAAVGATSTIGWMVGSSLHAIGVGFLAFIAKAIGAGNEKEASRTASQAVLVTMIAGLLFTGLALGLSPMIPVWMQVDPAVQNLASQYFFILYAPMLFRSASIIFGTMLRAAGDTKTPMRAGIWVNITNIVLNYFMIYPTRTVSLGDFSLLIPGAGLGVIGAALASAIAFTLGGILISRAFWKHSLLSPRGQSFRPDWSILKPCMKVAFPNMLQRFATSFGYVAFAAMINSVGEIATAAHTIANTVESAFYIPAFGMQTAAATLTGNALGAKDNEKLKKMCRMCLYIEIFLMLISGSLLFLLAPLMMQIFSSNPEVIQLGTTVLRMVAVTEPFYGVAIIIEGMLMGTGDTFTPFIYSVLGMWGIRILGTFFCTQFWGMGLVSAWACMILHNLFLFTAFTARYVSGRWNPMHKIQSA